MRFVVLACLVLGCGAPAPRTQLIPAASARALPHLEYTLLAGGAWSSANTNTILVIDVWASWCKPCKKAFPKLDRLAAANPDIVVLGLSVDEEEGPVRKFLAEVPVRFPIVRDPKRAPEVLAVKKLSTVIVVDRAGRIRARIEEPSEADYGALPELIAALRAE